MAQVDFYHLTRRPLSHVLPRLAERVLASGARLLIVAEAEPLRAHIDALLWTWSPASFLPHGFAGDPNEASQPIVIAAEASSAHGANNVLIADGIWREEALGFARALYLFDQSQLAPARAAWRSLADREEVARRYWKQDEAGRWQEGP